MHIEDHINEFRAELAVAINPTEAILIKRDLDAALRELAEHEAAFIMWTVEPPE